MLTDKHIKHLTELAFIQKDDTNVFENKITKENIIYKIEYREFQPYQTDYNRRMHDICRTLNAPS